MPVNVTSAKCTIPICHVTTDVQTTITGLLLQWIHLNAWWFPGKSYRSVFYCHFFLTCVEDTDDTVVSVCSETVILCLFVFCCLHELWYRLQLLTVLVRGQISGLKYNDTSRYAKLRSLQTRVAASRLYASASLRSMSLLHTSCLLEINKFKKLRTHVQPDELYDHYSFKVDSKDEHHQTQLWNPVTTSPSVPEFAALQNYQKTLWYEVSKWIHSWVIPSRFSRAITGHAEAQADAWTVNPDSAHDHSTSLIMMKLFSV